jgi:serine/threonine-protein kinase
MSAEATLARLPTRKGDEPLGDRAARAPDWRAPRGGDTIAYGKGKGVVRRDVGLLRVASRYAGVDEEIATGLAAYDVDLRAMTDARAVPPAAAAVVVDAGDRLDGALAALEAVRAAAPGTPVLVCAAGLDTDGVNALVAAGAADVLRYPVATDKLARKLSRVIRHGR